MGQNWLGLLNGAVTCSLANHKIAFQILFSYHHLHFWRFIEKLILAFRRSDIARTMDFHRQHLPLIDLTDFLMLRACFISFNQKGEARVCVAYARGLKPAARTVGSRRTGRASFCRVLPREEPCMLMLSVFTGKAAVVSI